MTMVKTVSKKTGEVIMNEQYSIRVRPLIYKALRIRAEREGLRPSEAADDILRSALKSEMCEIRGEKTIPNSEESE